MSSTSCWRLNATADAYRAASFVDNIISAAAVGAAITAMVAEIAETAHPNRDPELIEPALILLAVVETLGLFLVFNVAPAVHGIRSTTLRIAAMATAGAALIVVHQYGGCQGNRGCAITTNHPQRRYGERSEDDCGSDSNTRRQSEGLRHNS